MLWYLLVSTVFLWLIFIVDIGKFCYLFFFVRENRNFDLKIYFSLKVFVYLLVVVLLSVYMFDKRFVIILEQQMVLLLFG